LQRTYFLWCEFTKSMNICNPLSFLSNTQSGMHVPTYRPTHQHPKCGIRFKFRTYRHIFPIILQILVALCFSTRSNCCKEINFYACLQNYENWPLILSCLSVHSSHWTDFYVISYVWVFWKSVRKIWAWLKFVKNKVYFMSRLLCVYDVSLNSCQNEICFR
jgi:hypothetical protein